MTEPGTLPEAHCKECDCQTGGGEYCYRHTPYMVWPKADGWFLVDRNGRKGVVLEEPPFVQGELDNAYAEGAAQERARHELLLRHIEPTLEVLWKGDEIQPAHRRVARGLWERLADALDGVTRTPLEPRAEP